MKKEKIIDIEDDFDNVDVSFKTIEMSSVDLIDTTINRNNVYESLKNDDISRKFINEYLEPYRIKYRVDLSFDSILDFSRLCVELDSNKVKNIDSIIEDTTYNFTKNLQFKLIFVAGMYLNKLLDTLSNIKTVANDLTTTLMVEKLFLYIEKLETLKQKYKIEDLSKLLKTEENEITSSQKIEELSMVKEGLQQLRKIKEKTIH